VNCPEAQNKILESFDDRASFVEDQKLQSHLSACIDCSQFAELNLTIDRQLMESLKAPALSARFQPELRRRIQSYERQQWASWLPDAAYIAGSVVALLLCTALLPIPHSIALSGGAFIATAAYVIQSVLMSSLEEFSRKQVT